MSQGFGKCKADNHSHSSKKRALISLNLERSRADYQRDPGLLIQDLEIFREHQILTGEKLLWGFDLSTNEGFRAAMERVHHIVFNN